MPSSPPLRAPSITRLFAATFIAVALVGFVTLGGLWPSDESAPTPGAPLGARFEEPLEDAGNVLVTPVSEGGLRRVAPEEQDLFQDASRLRPRMQRGQPVGIDPTLPGLAGYR